MSPTLTTPELEAPPEISGGGGGFDGTAPGGEGGGGGRAAPRYDTYQTGVWVLLVPIVMLFVGLTSSLVVRRGTSDDWVSIRVPRILWLNTAVLLASSVTFERARRALRGPARRFGTWLWLTAGLGTAFLVGQVLGWLQLRAEGVFLASNPSSSFFYLLTATHGAHLVGGMTALVYLTARFARNQFGPRRQSALRATAVYWHFMDVLWIYLLVLLVFWR